MKNVLDLVRPNIARLTPYSTARDEYKGSLGVFLDANENPFQNGYNRYPDPRQKELKEIISKIKNIPTDQIFIGNGSDEAIDICFRIFCEPGIDNAVAIAPSYGMYRVAANINNVEVREVQLNEDFSLPVDRLLQTADSHSKLLFLCSPNNPSGNSFDKEDILRLIDEFPGIVVVDEAYIDFSSKESLLSLISPANSKDTQTLSLEGRVGLLQTCKMQRLNANANAIILQTLSKAYGMAALRLGLAFSTPEIMQYFANVKYPYNINLAAMQQAKELLKRDVKKEVEIIISERERVTTALATKPNVRKVYPSDANFLLVEVDDADATYERLIAKQLIVRNRTRVVGCKNCLRITIGTPEENDTLLNTI